MPPAMTTSGCSPDMDTNSSLKLNPAMLFISIFVRLVGGILWIILFSFTSG